MAKALELQIEDASASGGYFAFKVEGEYLPSYVPVYNEGTPASSNAPVIAEIRETWEFTNCKIVASDGTTSTLWATDIAALRSALFERAAHPTWVRLVTDPGGAGEAVLFTLGPSNGYEDLRFEITEGATDPNVPEASWRTTATFTLVVSARQPFADAVTGIVQFDQQVRVSYQNGLRNLRWTTRVTTAEGTSAVTAAETYARIPDSALGGDYAFQTNGPNGIEYEYSDADEQNSRIPTDVVAVSEIQQFGEQVGASAAGTSPNFYVYSIQTRKEKDVEETTYYARAEGPNALNYVQSKKPLGNLAVESITNTPTANVAEGTWVKRTNSITGEDFRDEFKITLSPGDRPVLLRATTGGFAPHESFLGFTHWKCVVQSATFRVGTEDIDLPGFLPDPWRPDFTTIEEGQAELAGQASKDASTNEYVRRATVRYYALRTPDPQGLPLTSFLIDQIRAAPRYKSYSLGA